jgi:6-phosphogluconolactonase
MEAAASAYEATLESELGVDKHFSAGSAGSAGSASIGRRPPRIDLVLLGLGRDGHTASLFPGAGAVAERARWVVATPAPGGAGERSLPRLTLTLPVLNAAREVIFLASGIAKADVVAEVLEGADMPAPERRKPPLPAARVVPADGRLTWLLDEGAAGRLRPGP